MFGEKRKKHSARPIAVRNCGERTATAHRLSFRPVGVLFVLWVDIDGWLY
jgi:hypothetical protein